MSLLLVFFSFYKDLWIFLCTSAKLLSLLRLAKPACTHVNARSAFMFEYMDMQSYSVTPLVQTTSSHSSHSHSPACVSFALTSVILLSWAVAVRHPTGAPTQGALKWCRPPTWRKQCCRCTSRQRPGGGTWGVVRMKDSAVAVQLFALPAQR